MKNESRVTVDTEKDFVFSVAKARYVAVHNDSKEVPVKDSCFSLASVFALPQGQKAQVSIGWIQEKVERYSSYDDVFHEQFLATVIIHSSQETDVEITDDAHEYLRKQGVGQVVCTSIPQILPGPYALVGKQLRDVWKLVDDSYGTCMVTVKPRQCEPHEFEAFPELSSDHRFSTFAIPSRIKTEAASPGIFAGLRVLVKDNIHLKGIKTSVGNRAFYETYAPQPKSAECLHKLIDQGAIILGKTKMNSLATWEEPTQYIDYQAPWNPRADTYQSPGGSSSGSAAAIAAYDWLDIAIGTDTWGSVTRPAQWCACYGLRPTFKAVSAHGIEPCCEVFDTAGILGRDLKKCRIVAEGWLRTDMLQQKPEPFTLVIWPADFWEVIDDKQVAMGREFARQSVSHLNAEYQEISFRDLWFQSSPEEAQGSNLSEYIDWAADVQDYDAYHNCDDFRHKYQKLSGHAPYVSLPNQKAWKFAQTVSKETRDEGFRHIAIYKKWFEDKILATTTGNVLIIMPLESMAPRYRDEPPDFKHPPPGINTLALAAVLNGPALTVPLAQIPYHSRVTDREEQLPFAVAVMSNPGTDLALMDTLHDILMSASLPTTVQCGRSIF